MSSQVMSSPYTLTLAQEPDHFLSHFKGYMTVRNGSRDEWKVRESQPHLYQVRGTNAVNSVAHEVAPVREPFL